MVHRAQPARDEAGTRLDELRRRLYRPGASAEDHRRYTEAAESLALPAPVVAASQPAVPVRVPVPLRHRLHPLLVLPVAVAGVVGVALSIQGGAPDATTGTAHLAGGSPPGRVIGTPRPIAISIEEADGTAQVFAGVGRATVSLDVSSAPRDGRAAISLSPGSRAPLAWRAVRLERRADGTTHEVVLGRSAPPNQRSLEVPAVFPFEGGPPMKVQVDARSDAHWTLVVGFVGAAAPGPQ